MRLKNDFLKVAWLFINCSPKEAINCFIRERPVKKHHKLQDHPSVQEISQTFMTNEKFSCRFVTEDQVREEIMNLAASKATPIVDIFVDILESTVDIHLSFIINTINLSIEKGCFPEELKLAEVSPFFERKDDLAKENYRPVIVLKHMLKVFERIMCHQVKDYMEDKLSKQLTGFRKNHSTQHCFELYVRNMKESFR